MSGGAAIAIILIANKRTHFLLNRNPNEPPEPEHGGRQEKSRFKNIEWTPYESVHKKYLNLGEHRFGASDSLSRAKVNDFVSVPLVFPFADTKPKLKNHYRAHRLSFWLNLVPDLHKTGTDDVPYSHHQLVDSDIDRPATDPTVKPLNPPPSKSNGSNYGVYTTQVFSLLNLSPNNNKSASGSAGGAANSIDDHESNELQSGGGSGGDDGFAAYSTALSVTIAIGCSLLILNVLIFAGVYYQRDKTRLNEPRGGPAPSQMGHHGQLNSVLKKRNENGQMPNNICGELETLTIHSKNDPATILGHHHALQHHQMPPPEFADIPQRAPPPPKHVKTMPCDGGMSAATANQLLPAHALQLIGANCTGTLQKPKSCVKNSNSSANSQAGHGGHAGHSHGHGQCHGQNQMDELRV